MSFNKEEGKRGKNQKNGYILFPTVCDDEVQLSGVQFAENTTKLQLKKLLEKEKELFRRLDGIIQAYS